MVSVSLCMIVKNEEEVLARCLESVKNFADEIIIVDTGSSDHTKKVAGKYTGQIFDFPWEDDFSAARNYAFSKGQMDYLMWLDADDAITPENAEKLQYLKHTLSPETDVVMMLYAAAFDEQGRSTFTYYRERMVKNHAGFYFTGKVHEVIPPAGTVFYSDIRIDHRKEKQNDSRRNLRIYEKMEAGGEPFDSRALYYYGRELVYYGNYEKGAAVLEKFLKREDGWTENRIDAARKAAVCYYGLKDERKALYSLLRTMEYDVPRAEVCCDLGKHFQDREQYAQAVYWYRQALNAEKNLVSGAFVEEDCYGFLPAISLSVCFDRMGDTVQAEKYNELAGSYKPESPYYLSNREYFESRTF